MVSKSQIIVLGCGLSGMITALKLAHHNISSTIIESRDISIDLGTLKDNRTTAFTSSSRKFFVEINLWDEIKNFCNPIRDIYVVDNKSEAMLHFNRSAHNPNKMGYLIQNHLLKKILLSLVQKNSLIKIIDKCNYQKIVSNPNSASIFLDHEQEIITADLVIICDGRNSKVRNHYFSNKFLKTYQQCALTFNVTHKINHEGVAVEHFLPSGPFAILPLIGGYDSSIVWTLREKEANHLLQLNEDEFLYLVKQNFGSFLGDISISSEVQSFPLSAYHAEQYFYQCLVLVADSAHVIHPLAGQGLNQGIKDIISLAENIAKYGINKVALSSYEQARKADNFMMYLLTDNLNKIFSNNSHIMKNVRRLGFKLIENMPWLKDKIVKYAMGQR